LLRIDGSHGEGGGQVLRTALTLSIITSTPFEIYNIRANRSKPGLRPQHLTCVAAAQEICEASVSDIQIGTTDFQFIPKNKALPGRYHWDVGTAGSTVLVMQTVLLPLVMAAGASKVIIEGGTHVPYSPSAHYLRDAYVPMLIQSGGEVFVSLDRYGWRPKGGGQITAQLEGWSQLHGQDLMERGALERIFGYGVATNLPAHIPQRITDHVMRQFDYPDIPIDVRPLRDNSSRSKGAGLFLTAEYANGRAGFSQLGEVGLPAEHLAEEAVYNFELFNTTKATVDQHLADQLVLILALAQGASQFVTPEITEHLRTNIWVIQKFVTRDIVADHHLGHVQIKK